MRTLTGGGQFEPAEEPIYFIAGHSQKLWLVGHPFLLIGVDALGTRQDVTDMQTAIARGAKVLLDSGVFWLANGHARTHGMTMDEALALAPEEIDGFDWLIGRYVELVQTHEADLWGYVELDQGGAENKKRTRARLESLGLRPIPVYHPLNDGWDYFDELCSSYDRVCFGNIVQANLSTRRALLQTLWERHRKYPDVWVHVLGLTPSEVLTTYPVDSCDSSSWLYAVRYGAQSAPGAHAMGDSFGKYQTALSYDPELEVEAPGGQHHGVQFLVTEAAFMQRVMRSSLADLLGTFDTTVYPPLDQREGVAV